ncbi:MAG TPA: four-helix bundle copper-binding protein [Planctomycetota bacterium]|nr:four-helix bundle copper-binding protein [Planctomycetota bacterium]
MHHIKQMFESHAHKGKVDVETLAPNVEEIFRCAQTCLMCADACLGEQDVKPLVRCIRINLDCAEVCNATAAVLSRLTEPDWDMISSQLRSCVQSCKVCAAECEKHASKHEHCRVCAETCGKCAETCDSMLAEMPVRK